jgi:hypothetical protein
LLFNLTFLKYKYQEKERNVNRKFHMKAIIFDEKRFNSKQFLFDRSRLHQFVVFTAEE